MIKRFHEAPVSIFEDVQAVTDGDYCLVHLLSKNSLYRDKFKEAIEKGREVILDNSVFELGTHFDMDEFAYWVKEMKPTYYILPDVLNDGEATIQRAKEFLQAHPDLPGKIVGVVQGKNYEECVDCYKFMNTIADKIAISMDYTFMQDESGLQGFVKGRQMLLTRMRDEGIINRDKPHHLLGVMLPQEMKYYREGFEWIDSVDTSNPVLHGMLGMRYGRDGLKFKASTKMHTVINASISSTQLDNIMYNIKKFRRMCYE